MAVRKFYSTKAKAGWRFDAKQNKFWSYGFDIYLESGKRKRESGFGSKQLAENAVSRIKISEKENTYNLQIRKCPLLSDVLEKHVLRIEGKKAKGRAVVIFNQWLSLIPTSLRFNELTPALIRLFIDERQSKVKASSINREVTFIASAIHSAYIDFPELENFPLPKIPRPKVEKSRRERLITHDEITRLLNYLLSARRTTEKQVDYEKRQIVGQVFQMCLLTGSRVGEITALRWSQIDFDAKILQIYGRKNRFKVAKTVRYLELNPTIEQILRTRKEIDAFGEFVFCRTGNSITKYHQILREASNAVGIIYGRNERGGFITHDARHTAVTRMLQAGVDLSTVGAITGHSDSQLILHYSHATRESRKAATNVLENFVKGKAKKAS
ncbi:MAG: site-specific integrase [Acidobacteriota bacterium]|nr:site-specific integrase [Acidobacteriota bacterium]